MLKTNALEIAASLAILNVTLFAVMLTAYYEERRRSLDVLRSLLDEYGYDNVDNEQLAKEIFILLQESMLDSLEGSAGSRIKYRDLRRITDRVTNPYLDPAKINS